MTGYRSCRQRPMETHATSLVRHQPHERCAGTGVSWRDEHEVVLTFQSALPCGGTLPVWWVYVVPRPSCRTQYLEEGLGHRLRGGSAVGRIGIPRTPHPLGAGVSVLIVQRFAWRLAAYFICQPFAGVSRTHDVTGNRPKLEFG